ncbi:hypothetical protein AC579_1451 [Pseudocercospora musae]|uniref:Uncharacterized protein n=1 Tax=Pseudocercospora musae TaxID=113226 RepID=A0A139IMF3_9PEZI|nr:hypothetical protein AC579_1451 [Pseudocercospora musae]KXT15940.1 hypothetical protein AC579_1451 [Pseudocercospora musae]KXT15941.1 hypothetical protein AC579_1451 [Pseudocercospora musae]
MNHGDMSAEPLTSDISGAPEQSEASKQERAPFESTSPLTTPPSSPIPFHPKSEVMAENQAAQLMPPPPKPDAASKRKRSRDVDRVEPETSPTCAADNSQLALASKNAETNIDSTSTTMPDSLIGERSQCLKGNAAASSAPAQKAPPSNQGAEKSKSKTTKKKKKAEFTKQVEVDASDEPDEAEDEDHNESLDDSEFSDSAGESLPEVALPGFDWNNLQQRYRDRMDELNREENKVLEDFNRLIGYFSIWADVGSGQELHRSSKRLRTQLVYVQHEEEHLEEKRQHYVKVVDAFKSALALLQN